MQFYPAYKLSDVLNEYASAFFLLLEEAYRHKANDQLALAQISILSNAEQEDVERFFNALRESAQDPRDIINSDNADDYSGLDTIKEIL